MLTGDQHKNYTTKFGVGTIVQYGIVIFLVSLSSAIIYVASISYPNINTAFALALSR